MKKLIIFTLAITLLGANWSCKDALEIEPRQSIPSATALTSKDGISAALVSVYSRLKGVRLYGRDNIALPEALADNGFATNKSGRLLNEANNVQGAQFTAALWQTAYAAINQTNLILEAIPAATDPTITQADRTSWEAQLFFLRALYHFDMVKAYAYMPGAEVAANNRGGIPILTKGISTSDDALLLKPSRAPIADVYAQIVSDLEAANSRFAGTTGLPNLADRKSVV